MLNNLGYKAPLFSGICSTSKPLSVTKKVFILGATGYIGGSLFITLKKKYPEFSYTALIRWESTIESVREAGATVVQGSFSDLEKISEFSEHSDIVINAANCDNVELSVAILKGLEARHEKGNGMGTLLHTSGTSNFFGEKLSVVNSEAKVWTDSEADIKLLNPSMLHGQVDIRILKAGQEGYLNTFIICPSIVHGRAFGPINRSPAVTTMLVSLMMERKHAFCIGDGSRSSGLINIEDLVHAYLLVVERALQAGSTTLTTSPYTRYFIASSEQMKWKDIFSLVAEALHNKGKLESEEPKDTPADELGLIGSMATLGTLERPGRLAELGWTPVSPLFEVTVLDGVDSALSALKL